MCCGSGKECSWPGRSTDADSKESLVSSTNLNDAFDWNYTHHTIHSAHLPCSATQHKQRAFALLSSSPEHLQRKFLLRPKQANVSKVRERTAVSFTQTTLSTTLLLIRLPHKIQALGAKKFAYIALVQPLSLVSIALIGHKHTFHNDKSCIVSTIKKVERMQTRAVTQLHIDVNAESTLSYIPNTRTH